MGPWYEEYDYADCTSIIKITSHQYLNVLQFFIVKMRCCSLSDALFTVAAKKQEEEEERARKEKAEKGFIWNVSGNRVD